MGGVVLEKIWRTYVELFERALDETRASLRRRKEKTTRVEAELAKTREELATLQSKHPAQIEKLSKMLAGKFTQRQEELEEQLNGLQNENTALQQHLQEQSSSVALWFPLFQKYKHSHYRKAITMTPLSPVSGDTPEALLAADFHRILSAMPPDSRRRVGFFVSSLLGLRGMQVTADTVEGLTERKEHNEWKIEQLEERLRKLKGDKTPPP